MTDTRISIVKNSWFYLVNNTENAGNFFYQALFELDPSLRLLFKENIDEQSQKLVTMLNFVVTRLHELDQIIPQIEGLAVRHIHYGVRREHYELVGQALIQTLEFKLDEHWNEHTEEAWLALYSILSGVMIRATANISGQ